MTRCAFALLLFVLLAVPAVAEVVVITQKDGAVTSLSGAEVKKIFQGTRRYWQGGEAITVFTQTGTPVHGQFTEQVLGMSAKDYFIHWRKLLFTGKGTPPIDVKSDVEMKNLVAAKPGAIGYIASEALDESVKVLSIE